MGALAIGLIILYVWLVGVSSVKVSSTSVIHGDLCEKLNGRRFYLEEGSQSFVYVKNVSYSASSVVPKNSLPVFHRALRRHRKRRVPSRPNEQLLPKASYDLLERLSGSMTKRRPLDFQSDFQNAFENVIDATELDEEFYKPQESKLPNVYTTKIELKEISKDKPKNEDLKRNMSETNNETNKKDDLLLYNSPSDQNVASKSVSEKQTVTVISSNGHLSYKTCKIELFTSSDCHLEIHLKKINLPRCSHSQACLCDYLQVREPPYVTTGGRDICGTEEENMNALTVLTTQTRHVELGFFYKHSYQSAFEIIVRAKKNRFRVVVSSNQPSGIISTPFFPELYPNEHWMEYIIEAKDRSSRIKLYYLDFQISSWSFIEIHDTNKSRMAVLNGNTFRPPVLISSGPIVTLIFSANGEAARGFKLNYEILDSSSQDNFPPFTDCGGYVTNFGGVISMINMTQNQSVSYDCVWIIRPPRDYVLKSHLLLKIIHFDDMEEGSVLEVHQGMTSEDYLLQALSAGNSYLEKGKEHVVAIDTGFYVRLKATFRKSSRLVILYSTFSYLGSCYQLTDLLCHNQRCIPKLLRCDGFDHCGDNTDEPKSCYEGKIGSSTSNADKNTASWSLHAPNYYFPQKTSLLDAHHGSGILLIFSLFILLLVLIGLLSFMFRQSVDQNARRHLNRTLRSHESPNDSVDIIDASEDDPPVYEPPPNYEDVLKYFLAENNFKLIKSDNESTRPLVDPIDAISSSRPIKFPSRRTRHASLDLDSTGQRDRHVFLIPDRQLDNLEKSETENDLMKSKKIPSSLVYKNHQRRSSLPLNDSFCGKWIVDAGIRSSQLSLSMNGNQALDAPSTSFVSLDLQIPSLDSRNNSLVVVNKQSNFIRKSGRKNNRKIKLTSSATPSSNNSSTDAEIKSNLSNCSSPPSYDMVLEQKLIRNIRKGGVYSKNDTLLKSTDLKRSSRKRNSTIIRIRTAREKFHKLSRGEEISISQNSATEEPSTNPAPELLSISEGIVEKTRKRLLQNVASVECNCNGACTCTSDALLETEKRFRDFLQDGVVKSKINFYLNIENNSSDSYGLKNTIVDFDKATTDEFSDERNSNLDKSAFENSNFQNNLHNFSNPSNVLQIGHPHYERDLLVESNVDLKTVQVTLSDQITQPKEKESEVTSSLPNASVVDFGEMKPVFPDDSTSDSQALVLEDDSVNKDSRDEDRIPTIRIFSYKTFSSSSGDNSQSEDSLTEKDTVPYVTLNDEDSNDNLHSLTDFEKENFEKE